MPGKNVVRNYSTDAYYHIYNRGVEKRDIFIDKNDYAVFLSFIKRYLDTTPEKDSRGNIYKNLSDSVELIAFCLMPNHFHLLLYQIEIDAITELMRAICSSYSMYFNQKYDREGTLFQGKYRAVSITNDDYLQYISRYIHRNPVGYLNYAWSSLRYWTGDKSASWINSDRLNGSNKDKYLDYLKDSEEYTRSIEDISNIIMED